jgi:arsenate reductase
MAEGLLNYLGAGRVTAFSAGSRPTGQVHPGAIQQLDKLGYDTSNMHSKSWQVFAQTEAPQMDLVITVCDNAANETCPIWPGAPVQVHWGFPDPAAVKHEVFEQIRQRVQAMLALPLEQLEPQHLKQALQQLSAEQT